MRAILLIFLLATHLHGAGLGVYNPAQHAVNGFMPTQLPGLALWIYAGNASATNGGNISYLAEFGPNAIHLTNTGGSKTPILGDLNGRPTMQFDGVDDYLSTKTAVNFAVKTMSVFVSGRKTSAAAGIMFEHGEDYNVINSFSINANNNLGEQQFMAYNIHSGSGYNVCFAVTNGITESNFVYSSATDIDQSASSETSISINGTDKTKYQSGYNNNMTGTISDSRILYLGGRTNAVGALNIQIGESIFYTRVVSKAERLQVERYLGTKYGIVVK